MSWDGDGPPVQASDPAGRAYFEVPFSAQASDIARPGHVLIDGTQGWTFAPRVLSVGPRPSGDTDQPNDVPVPQGGEVPIEVRGLYKTGGGTWLRRFVVPVFRRVEVDVSSFRDVRVRVPGVSSAGSRVGLYATVSNRIPAYDRQEPVWWPEVYTTPGDYVAPPGAVSFVSSLGDPGWSWLSAVPATAAPLVFLQPIAAGVDVEALAGRFRTTVPNLPILWRIAL